MDFSNSMGSDALASLTGKTEKAIVRIFDDRLSDNAFRPGVPVAGATLGGLAAKKVNYQNSSLEQYNREFKVQFNPSSIRVGSRKYSDSDLVQADGSQKKNNIGNAFTYPDMDFSVQLVFAQVVPNEAFIGDTMFKNYSTIAETAANKVLNAKFKDNAFAQKYLGVQPVSVQTAMDAFIGAIRSTHTRRVCFSWNHMNYEGNLISVRSTYTMFDLYGRPIRGNVNLQIRIADPDQDEVCMGYWQDAYDSAFGFDPLADSKYAKLKNVASKASSGVKAASSVAAQGANAAGQLVGLGAGITELIYDDTRRTTASADASRTEDAPAPLPERREERKFSSGRANAKHVTLEAPEASSESQPQDRPTVNELIGDEEKETIPERKNTAPKTYDNGLLP